MAPVFRSKESKKGFWAIIESVKKERVEEEKGLGDRTEGKGKEGMLL
jgi:hypothetical protein